MELRQQNRRKLSAKDIAELPKPLEFRNDVRPILSLLEKHQVDHFGQADAWLLWPINRAQSLTLLAHFCQVCLPRFGHFQDAMTGEHESQWSLYHSRLSFAINSKILSPREVIDAAIRTYHQAKGPSTSRRLKALFARSLAGASTCAGFTGAICRTTRRSITGKLHARYRVISGQAKPKCAACNTH